MYISQVLVFKEKNMAEKKGNHGGKRQGAGRKVKPKETFLPPMEDDIIDDIIDDISTEKTQKTAKIDKESIIQAMNTCDMKNLKCPVDFEDMPFAKIAWKYVLDLDKKSKYHLINERHFESLKSYCLAVEIRQRLIAEWEQQNKAMTVYAGSVLKINPIVKEIDAKSKQINKFAEDLGLTILSEFKMAEMSSKNKADEDNDDGMFE